jgi:iron complex outermembrane receptor protein
MRAFLLFVAIFIAVPCVSLAAQRELLLFQEIPTVFTVSKREQPVTDSPSAVSIITEEEIRASGATSIADLLRMVPGVDVMAISATDINVNVRGFNKEASHKLLVLIDGRSVYLDFMGIVLWEPLPVTMEEIKRIEVVKGPGSAVWGANAYSGIINIVTKRPGEIRETTVSMTGLDTDIGSIIHGGKKGETSYKLSAGWKQTNHWSENNWGDRTYRDEEIRALEAVKGSFMVERWIGGGASLILSGGIDDSNGETLTALDVYKRDQTSSHLKLDYQRDWLRFHTYWNGLDADIKETLFTERFSIKTNTYDFDLQCIFDTGFKNSLIGGLSYRINTVDSEILGGHHQQGIHGIYLQDDFRPTDGLLLTAGARYDRHPLVGWNLSPRVAAIYTPSEGHTLRLSYTTAYSLPTFSQSYLNKRWEGFLVGKGNKDVDEEKIRSLEAGYHVQMTERVKGSADIFYNELEDFITFVVQPDGTFSYFNRGEYKAQGGEVGLEFYIARDLLLRTNYSYQYIWNDEADTRVRYSPLSKANAELGFSPKRGMSATIRINYIGETNWASTAPSEDWRPGNTLTTRAGTDPKVSSYTLVNMKVGYRFSEETDISLSAFNLLNDRHREFIAGDDIGRRISVNLTARF